MNTLFIALVVITLVIVIIVQYTNIIKLTRQVNDHKEHANLMEVQRQDIVRISKSLFKSLLDETGIIPTDRMPFVQITPLGNQIQIPLDSIRFRLKDGKVLIYTNGVINPTEEVIRLNDITSLNENHMELIYAFLHELQSFNGKDPITIPLTPQKIRNILTYKH